MNDTHAFPTPHAANPDWDDPDLRDMLSGSSGWTLDNRHSTRLKKVAVRTELASSHARAALVSWEDDHKIVLLADFPVACGERLEIRKDIADVTRTIHCEVTQCRPGRRAGDVERHVHVVWARKRAGRHVTRLV
jgi:hypothetical protein